MSVSARPEIPDVDLGSIEFWGRPAEERDRYFEYLRREAPMTRHQPPEDILGMGDEQRLHYWAIVRHADMRRISRDPGTFCSSQGVQFGDAPQELLEASQSFLAMDAPRHTKLRGLVSSRSRLARSGGSRTGSAPTPSASSRRPHPPAAETSSS